MNYGEYSRFPYIWQSADWPMWRYDLAALADALTSVSRAQGLLQGRLAEAGLALRDEASLGALTREVIQTSAIEGERLDPDTVRSSVARRLGVDIGALAPVDRNVEGVVDMTLDATGKANEPVTAQRLFNWHAALFPTGRSGMTPIRVGAWRDDASGPMQVVSGPMGRQRVHFEAPPAHRLQADMARFLAWLDDRANPTPALLKAGIGHLWFVTLHPFDDGNGRIARAIGDLLLARAEASPRRFYSVSAQIQQQRQAYYDILERTQQGSLDITAWLAWFLQTLHQALAAAHLATDQTLAKARFWQRLQAMPFNARQTQILNRLLDGFEGKLTTRKWAAMGKCSADTALRDINDLVARGVLRKLDAGGRSVGYEVVESQGAEYPF